MTSEPASTITTEDQGEEERLDISGMEMDDLCWRWAAWSRSRRFLGPPPIAPGILGKLTSKGTGARRGGPPDTRLSAELHAMNLAIAAQPKDVSRRVFELHYVHAVGNVKSAADLLGISRSAWYRHLGDFRQRAWIAHRQIMEANRAALDALPSAEDLVADDSE